MAREEARSIFEKGKGYSLSSEIANLVKQPTRKNRKSRQPFLFENLSDTEESSGLGLYITEELCHLLGSAEVKLATDG